METCIIDKGNILASYTYNGICIEKIINSKYGTVYKKSKFNDCGVWESSESKVYDSQNVLLLIIRKRYRSIEHNVFIYEYIRSGEEIEANKIDYICRGTSYSKNYNDNLHNWKKLINWN